MIKLKAVEPKGDYHLLLHFSDSTAGVYDFAPFVAANTVMTQPLSEPEFFARYFIELGALGWPNGFDLSTGALQKRLRDLGALHQDPEAA
ncbi:DUF2442 domain-containing protein [Oleiagrimonas sp. C23AA]|uniref:DUF2442 domain-containing protein n=1 Tax=Oleiagrimonas sp. C23AA TaxID=2719047 RepID=UPI0014219AF3|nr:DUF2442 domain-containing protein [Oleiagrimonas sp. C23AA]NII09475.1 DUF2442 domain-containing protein [Oleiagrimonas sp. C23AA]